MDDHRTFCLAQCDCPDETTAFGHATAGYVRARLRRFNVLPFPLEDVQSWVRFHDEGHLGDRKTANGDAHVGVWEDNLGLLRLSFRDGDFRGISAVVEVTDPRWRPGTPIGRFNVGFATLLPVGRDRPFNITGPDGLNVMPHPYCFWRSLLSHEDRL